MLFQKHNMTSLIYMIVSYPQPTPGVCTSIHMVMVGIRCIYRYNADIVYNIYYNNVPIYYIPPKGVERFERINKSF